MEPDILAVVRQLDKELGGSVKEEILTDLIRFDGTLCEQGFTFLRVSEGFAVFNVPRQDPEGWYGEKGWPAPAKEQVMRQIAAKYRLELHEPPDQMRTYGECHHHFELGHSQRALLVAHPRYLKVRISKWPIPWDRGMMSDLAALYGREN
jgi:hypothetical protein